MTDEEIKQLVEETKQRLTAQGVTPGSAQWNREVQNAFRGGRTSSTNNRPTNVTRNARKSNTVLDPKAKLQEAYSIYNRIMADRNSVSAEDVKKLQKDMVDFGLNVNFRDRNGKMRTGYDAIDGRWGNASGKAFEQYTALLNGMTTDAFDKDWAAKHPGQAAPNVSVAGRDNVTSNQMRNAYYTYFKEHPEIYAGLVSDPDNQNTAYRTLPYLDDAAKELLFDVVQDYNKQNGGIYDYQSSPEQRHLNTHAMAQQGLFNNSTNNAIMAADEGRNVRSGLDRAGRDMMQAYTWAGMTGQRLAGAVANSMFGNQPTDWGMVFNPNTAYEQSSYYNPVTGKIEWVTAPTSKEAITVADVAGVENPLGRFALNVATDPLALLSMAGTIKTGAQNLGRGVQNTRTFFRNTAANVARNQAAAGTNAGNAAIQTTSANAAKLAQRGLVPNPNGGVAQLNPMSYKQLRDAGLQVEKGPSNYITVGNVKHGAGVRRSHNASRVASTGNQSTLFIKPLNEPIAPEQYLPMVPMQYNLPYVALPTLDRIDYADPYYKQSSAGNPLVNWQYTSANPGNMYSEDYGDYPMTGIRSANSNNFWRDQYPQSGSHNAYWGGNSQNSIGAYLKSVFGEGETKKGAKKRRKSE